MIFIVDRARNSFRQSFRFGNMGLRDRGHRLAGYLTPPSDVTQEEEEAASEKLPCDTSSDKVSQTTVLRIEPPWDNNSAPTLLPRATKEMDTLTVESIPVPVNEEKTSSTNKVMAFYFFSLKVI